MGSTRKNEDALRYDASIKKFLSQKIILSHILVYTVEEFEGRNPKEVVKLIEGTPEVSSRRVYEVGDEWEDYLQSEPSRITGINTESVSNENGPVFFDIRFYVYTDDSKQTRVKMIIEIEAQAAFNLKYDIVTRGVYYCARMISTQKEEEFTGSNYQDIKKVYSIWICVNPPKYAENTITRYSMKQENLVGHFPDTQRYDLMSVVLVCLSEEIVEEKDEYRLHRLLEAFFVPTITMKQKTEILEHEYDIRCVGAIGRSVNEMCNVGEYMCEVYKNMGLKQGLEEGLEQGLEQGLERGLEQGLEQGKRQLKEAVKLAIRKEYTTPEQLVAEGYSEDVANDALELLMELV